MVGTYDLQSRKEKIGKYHYTNIKIRIETFCFVIAFKIKGNNERRIKLHNDNKQFNVEVFPCIVYWITARLKA